MRQTASPAKPSSSYSTAEVARLLGVSAPTVQRWVDAGFLKAWKTAGGHRRIDADSVQRVRAAQQSGRDMPQPEVTQASASGPAPLTVMVVDDNPDDRDIMSALIESALPEARIVAMHDGFEALVTLGRMTPDILITDIVMPHMNGAEMLRRLSRLQAHRPGHVFAVSSCAPDHPARRDGLPAEVRFFSKPVDRHALTQALRDAAQAVGLANPS